jgi:hypothetical protein
MSLVARHGTTIIERFRPMRINMTSAAHDLFLIEITTRR